MPEYHPSYIFSSGFLGYKTLTDAFLQGADVRIFNAGDTIISQKHEMQELYLVLRGTVEVSHTDATGRTKLAMLADRGMLIGLSGLLDPMLHHTHRCRTNAIIAAQPLEAVHRWDRDVLLDLIHMQTEKMRLAIMQLQSNTASNVERRIIRLLLEQVDKGQEISGIDIPLPLELSKVEIAQLIGATRERVGQVLLAMQEQGLIHASGKAIFYYPSRLIKVYRQLQGE